MPGQPVVDRASFLVIGAEELQRVREGLELSSFGKIQRADLTGDRSEVIDPGIDRAAAPRSRRRLHITAESSLVEACHVVECGDQPVLDIENAAELIPLLGQQLAVLDQRDDLVADEEKV